MMAFVRSSLAAALLVLSPSGGVLADVRTFMYQFQDVESSASVDALARSRYDLLIVEPVGTYRSGKSFDMKALVGRLRGTRPGRLVLAYFNLSEADSHRSYWESSWKEPAGGRPGQPDFLVAPDPDGWKDTYVVRYWDPGWQALLLADLHRILAAGFDGVCLDWADAFESPALVPLAKAESRTPARDLVDWVARIRDAALRIDPQVRILLQNPSRLLAEDARIGPLADAVLYEHVWYSGKAEVSWADARGGDLERRGPDAACVQEALLLQMENWKKAGKPVLTLDYCVNPAHAREVYDASRNRGFVPLVSRSALDRMTETAPPGLR
jgi:cysteinyl-tRNA synthetase